MTPKETPKPEVFASLYRPALEFEEVPGEDFDVFRIIVDGVPVRYHEKGEHLVMTIEGNLPSQVIENLTEDLKSKLGKVLKSEIKTRVYQ